MFCAYNQQGASVWATHMDRQDGPFLCPACQQAVTLKKGRVKIPHFAHQPAADCSYAGQGESEEHRKAKIEIYHALVKAPGVSDVLIERYLGDVRPDISFVYTGKMMAVEVQISDLSLDDIERRTQAYARRDIAVLWTPPLPMSMGESRYAPRNWERYLHGLFYGAVYYWSKDLRLQPVQFAEYLLAPSWYRDEKRSKRFVTPVFQHECSILDLVPRWRTAWRAYPHAKLLLKPWSLNATREADRTIHTPDEC